MACHFESAEQESENFKLDFDEYSNNQTIFKFVPTAAYQRDNEKIIYYGDCV